MEQPLPASLGTGVLAQLIQLSHRETAVLSQCKRLRLARLGSHFSDDGFFLVAIETQGLLLKNVPFGDHPMGDGRLRTHRMQRPSASGTHGPNLARRKLQQRVRHLRRPTEVD